MTFSSTAKPRDALSIEEQRKGLLELYNVAYSTLTRCKEPGQLLKLDAILLDTLVRRPGPHSLRTGVLSGLASSLVAKFNGIDELRKLSDGFLLRLETLDRWRDSGECTIGFQDQQHNPDSKSTTADIVDKILEVSDRNDGRDGDANKLPKNMSDIPSAWGRNASQSVSAHQPELIQPLRRLAAVLETRFGLLGHLKDLDEAISLYRVGVQSWVSSHPNRPEALHSLSDALKTRFDWTGRQADLDEAILLNREALELLRPFPDEQPLALERLAISLHRRFTVENLDQDLEDAIDFLEQALELRFSSHPDRPLTLSSLASALVAQYKSGSLEVLENAIDLIRQARALQPAPRPDILHSLADAIFQRYDDSKQAAIEDRDEVSLLAHDAIHLTRNVLGRLPNTHPHRSTVFHDLADSLLLRFKVQKGEKSLLSEALKASQDALRALPVGHPAHCRYSSTMGEILYELYDDSQHTEPRHLEDSITAYRAATKCASASPFERFNAATAWVDAMNSNKNHGCTLEAYQTAIELRTLLAPLDLDIQSRRRILKGSEEIVSSAVAHAIKAGRLDKAIEFLEQGRTVFWSQALQLRFSTDNIYSVAPELAKKLDDLSRELERGSQRDASRTGSDIQEKVIAIEREAIRYHNINQDWLAAVDEVRDLEGFKDFLRPKPFTTLQKAASHSPVVMLIDPGTYDEEDYFAALVLTSSIVEVVPLPLMDVDLTNELVDLVQTVTLPDDRDKPITHARLMALKTAHSLVEVENQTQTSLGTHFLHHKDRGSRLAPKISADEDDVFRCVLGILWKAAVKPVIRALSLEKSVHPPRLWWCPTGKLAILPLHAAGIYSATDRCDCVSDYAIPSYTPTLSALLVPPPPTANELKVVVVVQPQTPGYNALPYVHKELQHVKRYVPKECLVTLGTSEAPAIPGHVLSHLSDVSIVHLACHGERGEDGPLNDAFILEDGQKLELYRVMELSMPKASLAFLCACHTATADDQSPDEVINLATSLLFAGFRGSISTMWSIADEDGPKVADGVYRYLFKPHSHTRTQTRHPHPDVTQTARGLSLAIANLRAENCSFKRWVPFVHLGL